MLRTLKKMTKMKLHRHNKHLPLKLTMTKKINNQTTAKMKRMVKQQSKIKMKMMMDSLRLSRKNQDLKAV